MSDKPSDYAVLLRALDFAAAEVDSAIYEEAASAIRALEAKVSELRAERSEFDCRFAGRHWEASGSHCPTDRPCLRCQRDRLAAENAALREDAT